MSKNERNAAHRNTVQQLVGCDSCVHCGYRNGQRIVCKYPRERAPEAVDLTDALGYTRIWAAEVCPNYTPNAGVDGQEDAQ